MTFYANRQISTGWFIPAGGKGIGGHTHQAPCVDRPPRLFMKEQTARTALRCWLQGEWYESGGPSGPFGEEWDWFGPEPKDGTARQAADFETVAVVFFIGKEAAAA